MCVCVCECVSSSSCVLFGVMKNDLQLQVQSFAIMFVITFVEMFLYCHIHGVITVKPDFFLE